MSLQRLGARGSTGKGWGLRRQWPDGLYPLCTTWHVSDVVLPSTSDCILCRPCESTFLSVRSDAVGSWSDPAVVLPIPFLACPLHICLSQLPHAAPYGTCVLLCTTRGKNDAQQPESFPISQFSNPVSLSTCTPSPMPLHRTQPQQQPQGTNRLGGGNSGLENH